MSECKEHKKVPSGLMLASNPPQFPWICSECGKMGVDRGKQSEGPTYDQIYKKFHGGG